MYLWFINESLTFFTKKKKKTRDTHIRAIRHSLAREVDFIFSTKLIPDARVRVLRPLNILPNILLVTKSVSSQVV
jgi:hypothetical protein